jgi:hypothetical protein
MQRQDTVASCHHVNRWCRIGRWRDGNGLEISAPKAVADGTDELVGDIIKIEGSRLVKPMRKLYKANDDGAKLLFSPVACFGAQISAVAAAVLSGYGSH